MISLRQRVLWASMLAGAAIASSGAFAQQTPSPAASAPAAQVAPAAPTAHAHGDRADPAKRHARMQEHRARRLAALKEKLHITSAQEGAWSAFTAANQPPAGQPPQQRADRAEFAKLTTPQRLDRMQARQAERSAMFARHADATRSFYAALNADQQKTFDAETARMGHGRHDHRGPGHRGERGDHGGHGGADGHRPTPPANKG